MKLLILVLSVLYATSAYSSVQILSIQGNQDHISIERNNKQLIVREFLILQDNDVIRVKKGNSKVVLDLNEGKKITIDHDSSPYKVLNTVKNSSLITNLAAWVNDLYAGYKDDGITATSMSTRGNDNKIMLEGMDLRNNIIPRQLNKVVFFWNGGKKNCRFDVTVYGGDEETLIFHKETSQHESAIPLSVLPEGDYLIEINDLEDDSVSGDNQYFSIVNNKTVHKEVRELKQTLQHENYQILVAGLATIPEYRFYALQVAKEHGDEILVRALLGQMSPEKK